VAVGLSVVYLTQVRSVLLVAIASAAVIGFTALRRREIARAGWVFGAGAVLVVASFLWAASLGGDAVQNRFMDISSQGALATYQENRGNFLSYTVGELLDRYPLGAGLGRWGMMQTYFGNPTPESSPIHVEIQLTGWLLDGGIPMWVLYGAALLFSMASAARLALRPGSPLAQQAALVLGIQCFIVAMSFSGPAFNMQLGILFWACTAALHGAASAPPDDRVSA
jgi:hypothetical protein